MHTDNTALAEPPGPAIDLDSLYAAPAERIQKAVRDRLSDFHEAYLRQASFFCLATAGESGLDASPRGGPPGFVQVLDERTVAFADWPGNNRIESLRNLQADDRLAMLFLFPGLDIFLRINGRGRISTDPHLLQELSEGRGTPKTATVVLVDEVLLHCGKAIHRSGLWSPSSQLDRTALPSVGQMMAALTQLADATAPAMDAAQQEQANAHYAHAVRHDLY
ncbi:hypothetical protein CLV01_5601 [Delftia sp. 60]|uniref:MSMEG_1061 family FMN-dependent PPOX-type flavoprotein n=1 Tax=Delftia sp. 60 TaxID=2035216 RepID=UPI000C1920AC|nr:MSMEG_1061 family FMN-dependent PPOX-type flavoprotein [Delftia sp. 60]PIF35678.1 hypothetical protein CLU98_0852 [Burkholderiales bacterium 23]PIF69138.1 hypothetical protein CLV01_5601 [Delftia sp. 60]